MSVNSNERGIIWRTKNVNCTYIRFQRFIKDEFKPSSIFDNIYDHLFVNHIFNYINGKLDKDLRLNIKPDPTKFLQNENMQDFMFVNIHHGLICKITNFDETVVYIGPTVLDGFGSNTYRYDGVEKIKTIEIMRDTDVTGVEITKFNSIYKKFNSL